MNKVITLENHNIDANEILANRLAQLKKEKNEAVEFFKNCPYFFDNTCESVNWSLKSPCWDCFAQKSYDKRNACGSKNGLGFVLVKDEKCK